MKKMFLTALIGAAIIGVSFVSVPQVRDMISRASTYIDAVIAMASTGNFTGATCTISADPQTSPYPGAPILLTFVSTNTFATMEFNGEKIQSGATTVVYPTDTTTYTALLNGVLGCQYTFVFSKETPVASPLCSIETDVSLGASGSAVGEIQQLLINYGMPIVKTDVFDVRTQTALKLFQLEKVLGENANVRSVVTGVWDAQTRAHIRPLFNCTSTPKQSTETPRVPVDSTPKATAVPSTANICAAGEYTIGDRGDAVRTIQKFLIDQGYTKVEASGYFGELTKRAVKHYQETYAESILKPAGLSVGSGTWGSRTAAHAYTLGLCAAEAI